MCIRDRSSFHRITEKMIIYGEIYSPMCRNIFYRYRIETYTGWLPTRKGLLFCKSFRNLFVKYSKYGLNNCEIIKVEKKCYCTNQLFKLSMTTGKRIICDMGVELFYGLHAADFPSYIYLAKFMHCVYTCLLYTSRCV